MKGNDAFLVVAYGAYVSPGSPPLHPSPRIEQQNVELYISSDECDEIVASGAQNKPHDGIVKLFVDIDGIQAISTGEIKSGWDKWFYIIPSFGIECDKASHEIKIRVEQWVCEVLGMAGRWQKVFEDTKMLKFDKASAKKKKDILAKFKALHA